MRYLWKPFKGELGKIKTEKQNHIITLGTSHCLEMTFVGGCIRSISSCFYGTGDWKPSPTVPIMPVLPDVILDTSCMGKHFLPYGKNPSLKTVEKKSFVTSCDFIFVT